MHLVRSRLLRCLGLLAAPLGAAAQNPMQAAQGSAPVAAVALPANAFTGLEFRAEWPRGWWQANGISGSVRRPQEYLIATDAGIMKSSDGGRTWGAVSDRQLRSAAVGSIEVAPSNPDTVYAGMGDLRGNIGDGVYRSIDGGSTWLHQGLSETGAIVRVVVHPANAAVAWVAALGRPYARHQQRGVYRTLDAGRTWTKVLFRGDSVGAVDLALDPKKPDVLLATLWSPRRSASGVSSGGGSALFKSVDGGDSWTDLTRAAGLPAGFGRVAIAISPADGQRVYALVEHAAGGVFVSDDAGVTWRRANGNASIIAGIRHQARVVPDPLVKDRVWVLSAGTWRSDDGARTFRNATLADRVGGSDLWIAPDSGRRMAFAVPGGAAVSLDGGQTMAPSDATGATRAGATQARAEPPANRLRPDTPAPRQGPAAGATVVATSPLDPAVRWAVAASGAVIVSRDGGRNWTTVTPPALRPAARVVSLEPSPRSTGKAWAAVQRTTEDDRAPYIFKTSDFGVTWTSAADGIHEEATVHAVREDPRQAGLVFAGTQHGVAVSFDDGGRWQALAASLPDIPVTDLVAGPDALRILTPGRGPWTLDGLDVVRQLSADVVKAPLTVFTPGAERRGPAVSFYYYLARDADSVVVELVDANGSAVRRAVSARGSLDTGAVSRQAPSRRAGLNHFVWDLRSGQGTPLAPGSYQFRVSAARESRSVPIRIVDVTEPLPSRLDAGAR